MYITYDDFRHNEQKWEIFTIIIGILPFDY